MINKKILITLEEQEYEQIKKLAKENNMSLQQVFKKSIFKKIRKIPNTTKTILNKLTIITYELIAIQKTIKERGAGYQTLDILIKEIKILLEKINILMENKRN